MKKLLVSAALVAAAIAPTAATAQALPAAVVAVVDLDRVTTECNACKTAQAALRSQATAFDNRRNALGTSLQNEQKSIQTAVDALKGQEPDAALQGRIRAFQTKAQQGEQELATQQQQIQRNQQHILRQIQEKLNPIYQQVMQRRGANLLVSVDATLATAQTIDVTNDVLAGLNASLTSIATTAPAQPQQQQQPQGR